MSFKFEVKPLADLTLATSGTGSRLGYLDLKAAIADLRVGTTLPVPLEYWTSNGVSKPDLTDSDKVSSWRSARRGTINKFTKAAGDTDPDGHPRTFRVAILASDPLALVVIAEEGKTPTSSEQSETSPDTSETEPKGKAK